ncbi:MAG: Cpe/LpqF family protein [Ornithinimicrobium sp.]
MTRIRRRHRPASTRYSVRWAPVSIAALILAGCGDFEPEATGDAQESSQAQSPRDDASVTTQVAHDEVIVLADGVEIPEGATGEAFSWLLDALNADTPLDVDEVEQRFAQSFLEQVPAEDFGAGLEQIRANAPMQVTSIQPSSGTLSASVDGAEALAVDLALDDDGLINGLTFSPDPLANRPAPGGL